MNKPGLEWIVRRAGDTVRVDVVDASEITSADVDAIVTSVHEVLAEDGVRIMQLDGPVLDERPEGLTNVLLGLQELAERHDKQLLISPI